MNEKKTFANYFLGRKLLSFEHVPFPDSETERGNFSTFDENSRDYRDFLLKNASYTVQK